VKEIVTIEVLRARFPEYTWIHDRQVLDGCSRLRPDLYVHFGSHVVVLEVDENRHQGPTYQCEEKRMCAILQDFKCPTVFLRFNPDKYTAADGTEHKSCFGLDKRSGLMTLRPNMAGEWEARITALLARVSHWAANTPNKELEVEYLFY
jgi:hypothetical protein